MNLQKIFFTAIFTVAISYANLNAEQTFINVTSAMGISESGASYGQAVSWCDIDNDNDLDLAFSYASGATFCLYRNDGGSFTEITASSGLSGINAGLIFWAEVTGDDYTDLMMGGKLFQNKGNGEFTDISAGSGITGGISTAADFDKDGDVDLVAIGSEAKILVNNGSGQFTPSSSLGTGGFLSAVCLDYDNDGNMDIYLGAANSNNNKLLKNNGDLSFTDIASAAGVDCGYSSYSVNAGDFNNDGYMDLYVGNHLSQLSNAKNYLYKNNGDGSFSNITVSAGVIGNSSTRTASFVDYDNDGLLDLFVDDHYKGNKMYHNNGDDTFTDKAGVLNITGVLGDYFGMGWGDFNNDGAIDFFAAGHFHIYRLYENQNCPGNYLNLKLIGQESNFNAIGTKVELFADEQKITRYVSAGEGENDYHSLDLEFGLNSSMEADSIYIFWPSGIFQKIGSTAANQTLNILESADMAISEGNLELQISLFQNYPNPFNPITRINYNLSNMNYELVEVVVYNNIGQQVWQQSLVEASFSNSAVGYVEFDGSKFNSGIYYYSLVLNGNKIESRKMILTK